VKEFLHGSTTVLLQRIDHLEKLLTRVPHFPLAQQKCEEVRDYLRQLRDGVTDVLSCLPAPPAELKNLVDQYNALARAIYLLEQVFVGPVSRFSEEDDGRLCRLVDRIWHEIGLVDDSPLVVAASNQYFCTIPAFGIIFTPASEGESLLNLPDLYHELAHHLHRRGRPLFGARFKAAQGTYIADTEDEIKRLSRPIDVNAFRSQLLMFWRNWAEEVAADTFATLIVGAAYGWANLHLMLRVPSIFDYSGTHPADAARMEHILRVLAAIPEHSHQTARLKHQWAAYRQFPHPAKSEMYDLLHPPPLFTAVLEDVKDAIMQHGIQSSRVQEQSVAYVLNEAWHQVTTAPEGYRAWEQQMLPWLFS